MCCLSPLAAAAARGNQKESADPPEAPESEKTVGDPTSDMELGGDSQQELRYAVRVLRQPSEWWNAAKANLAATVGYKEPTTIEEALAGPHPRKQRWSPSTPTTPGTWRSCLKDARPSLSGGSFVPYSRIALARHNVKQCASNAQD